MHAHARSPRLWAGAAHPRDQLGHAEHLHCGPRLNNTSLVEMRDAPACWLPPRSGSARGSPTAQLGRNGQHRRARVRRARLLRAVPAPHHDESRFARPLVRARAVGPISGPLARAPNRALARAVTSRARSRSHLSCALAPREARDREVDKSDAVGATALFLASKNGHVEVAAPARAPGRRGQQGRAERGHGADSRVAERSRRGGAAPSSAPGRRGQQERSGRGHGADASREFLSPRSTRSSSPNASMAAHSAKRTAARGGVLGPR